MRITVEELVKSKVLREIELKSGIYVWAISLSKIHLKEPEILICDCCGNTVSVARILKINLQDALFS